MKGEKKKSVATPVELVKTIVSYLRPTSISILRTSESLRAPAPLLRFFLERFYKLVNLKIVHSVMDSCIVPYFVDRSSIHTRQSYEMMGSGNWALKTLEFELR